jgi:hypothetical protein
MGGHQTSYPHALKSVYYTNVMEVLAAQYVTLCAAENFAFPHCGKSAGWVLCCEWCLDGLHCFVCRLFAWCWVAWLMALACVCLEGL